MAASPWVTGGEKRHWWFSNRKIVDKYIKDARNLIASQDETDVASALNLLDAALSLSPRYEHALELRARCLLRLCKFKEVANMLQDYIPSLKIAGEESGVVSSELSSSSSNLLSRELVKLLSESFGSDSSSFKCFSVSDLKNKFIAGMCKNCDREGQWRYLVLGQACFHLGLMEDAMVLLQTGKRLATAASRRESICWSDDSFTAIFSVPSSSSPSVVLPPPRAAKWSESITHMLTDIKFLLRRRAAALAALDAGLYSESIRHFSKIVDGRRGAPQAFLAECYMHRSAAYRAAGRVAEAIADCNKTLALDPSCIQALETRALLLETIRCLPDSLHDLEHLKLLYNTILRDKKLPGPFCKRHDVHYREIPGKLCSLTVKIQQLKERVASGETGNVDYYSLVGIRRGCSKSELERAYVLLNLRHKPERAMSFMDRCEFVDQLDIDSVKDGARISALMLYRLIQKGFSILTANIAEEEAVEKQLKAAASALKAAQVAAVHSQQSECSANQETIPPVEVPGPNRGVPSEMETAETSNSNNANEFQGAFCRDLAVVGNLLSHARFNHPIPVKYEALSC